MALFSPIDWSKVSSSTILNRNLFFSSRKWSYFLNNQNFVTVCTTVTTKKRQTFMIIFCVKKIDICVNDTLEKWPTIGPSTMSYRQYQGGRCPTFSVGVDVGVGVFNFERKCVTTFHPHSHTKSVGVGVGVPPSL